MRRLTVLGAIASVLLVGPVALAGSEGDSVLRMVSTEDSAKEQDKPPVGPSKGDVVDGTSVLRNSVRQFGKPSGAVVGRDKFRLSVESKAVANIQVTATLPGGTIRCAGKINLSRARNVVKVVGGTGAFKGATGTCEATDQPNGRTKNVFRLTQKPAGEIYASTVFRVPLRMTLTEGWVRFGEYPEELDLKDLTGQKYGLAFSAEDVVIEPTLVPEAGASPSTYPAVAAPKTPEEFVRWLGAHPQLDAGEPKSATLGKAKGFVLETVTKGYTVSGVCETPCVALFGSGDGIYFSEGGEKTRWYVLDVAGKALVIGAWGKSPQAFDQSIGTMETVLRSIRFKQLG